MRKRLIASVAIGGLLSTFLIAGPAASAGKKPVTVAQDSDADWGSNQDAGLAPLGNLLGMELTGAQIGYDGKNVNFIIQVKSLPASGGMPEAARYIWDLTVDGKFVELDGKFTNYSRGACDPTSGQCPPPRDPGTQTFLVRGDCAPDPNASNITVCKEIGRVQAKFDAAAGTITIPVPAKLIKAKKKSKIAGAPGTFDGAHITAIPAAFFSLNSMPYDGLLMSKTYVVK